MKNTNFLNFAVFLIFFGIALIEALQNRSWLLAILFFILGGFALLVDFRGFNYKKER